MKPTAPVTMPVSARVAPAIKQLLLERAAQQQLSLCEYTAQVITVATDATTPIVQLQCEHTALQLQFKEVHQQLAHLQARLAWCDEPHTKPQLEAIATNIACLRQLYHQYGSQPVSIALAEQAGFRPANLLASVKIDGAVGFLLGPYTWRYTSATRTHLLIQPTTL